MDTVQDTVQELEDVIEDTPVVEESSEISPKHVPDEIEIEIQKLITGNFGPKKRIDMTSVSQSKYDYVKEIAMSYLSQDVLISTLKCDDYICRIVDETLKQIKENPDADQRFSNITPGYASGEARWLLRMAALLITVVRKVPRDPLVQKLVQKIIYLDVDLMLYFIDNMFSDAESLGMFLVPCRILADAYILSIDGDPKHLCMKASVDIREQSPQVGEMTPCGGNNVGIGAEYLHAVTTGCESGPFGEAANPLLAKN